MNAPQAFTIGAFAQIVGFMPKMLFVDELIAFPGIGYDRRTRLDMFQNKSFKRECSAIQSDMEANATHPLSDDSSFSSNGDNNLMIGSTATFTGALTADVQFIDLYTPGELFSLLANGTASELLKPTPSRAVAAKTQQLFQVHCIDTGLAGGKPPHSLEPISDRLFGAVHDRASGQ